MAGLLAPLFNVTTQINDLRKVGKRALGEVDFMITMDDGSTRMA